MEYSKKQDIGAHSIKATWVVRSYLCRACLHVNIQMFELGADERSLACHYCHTRGSLRNVTPTDF